MYAPGGPIHFTVAALVIDDTPVATAAAVNRNPKRLELRRPRESIVQPPPATISNYQE
jgi:hypothetical protein